jgi:hypothetical protein
MEPSKPPAHFDTGANIKQNSAPNLVIFVASITLKYTVEIGQKEALLTVPVIVEQS